MLFQTHRLSILHKLLARFTTAVLAATILVAAILAACSGPVQTAVDASSDAALVIAMPEGEAADALEAAAAVYAQASGQPVRVTAIPVNQYTRKIQAALMAGLDDYDLVYLTADALPKWAGYHALRPWNKAAESVPQMWRPFTTVDGTAAGGLYGLPAQADPLLLWYRADLLPAGQDSPDRSWPAFRAYAASGAASPERSGFIPAYAERDAALDLAVFLHGFGTPSAVELDTPQARVALEFFSDLSRDGLSPAAAVAAAASLDPAREAAGADRAAVIEALRTGRAAMGFAPRSAAASLLNCSDAESAACDGQQPLLKAARPPGDCLLLSELWVWGAPLRSKHPEAAEHFAAWLMSEEGARAWQAEFKPAEWMPEAAVPVAVLEPDTCFKPLFPPVRDPEPFWQALAELAVEPASHQRTAQAARDIQAELVRQGMISD